MKLEKKLLASSVVLSLATGTATSVVTAQPTASSPEYLAQIGLGAINVLPAWAQGLSGSGITIAVLDSGVRTSHVDLASKIVAGGFDFVNNDSSPDDDDSTGTGGHGTAIAGIAAGAFNSFGTVGVAYNASVLPVKIVAGDGSATSAVTAAGINYVAGTSAKVLAMTYRSDNSNQAAELAALQTAARAGKIIVIAAGNEGFAEPRFPANQTPALSGLGITVGNLAGGGNISSLAGSTMNSYLMAPGVGIASPGNASDTAIVENTGSSVAAPHVAGAAALIWGASPHLSGTQVVEILLTTATDLGSPGIDSTYGRGLLNIGAALSPVGGLSVSSGDSSGGGGMGLVALVLGGAVGYAILNRSETIKEAMVLDKYERAFGIDLSKIIEVRDDKRNLTGALDAMHRSTHFLDVPLADNLRMTVLYALPETPRPEDWDRYDPRFNDDVYTRSVAMTLQGGSATGLNYVFGINTDPTRSFGVMQAPETQGANFLTERVFTAPLMGFGSTANSVNLGYNLNETTGVKFGYAATDEHDDHGLKSNAAIIEGAYKPNDATTLRLQLAQLDETGSFFGGGAAGPLSARQAVTTSLGVSGAYRVAPTVSLIASYTEGYTRVRADQNSLLRGFSSLRSHAWGLGLVKSDLFTPGDRFGMALSQPLRVTRGTVDLSVPYARDLAGNIYRHNETVGLAPDGSERSLDAFYNLTVAKNVQAGAHFMYSHEPQHNAAVGDATTLFFTVESKF